MSSALSRTRPETCVSDLRLDELVGGELEGEASAVVEAHVASCERCARRLRELREDARRFAEEAPPLTKPEAPRAVAPRRRVAWIAPAAGALAIAAALALSFRAGRGPEPDAPGTRIKGGHRIGFYVRRGEAVSPGAPGEIVRPGDALRFVYASPDARWLAVLSVDGAAKASIYFPAGANAERIEAGSDVSLPMSTVLDATLGDETIYGLFCESPIALEPVRAALERAPTEPPAAPGCVVERVMIRKVAP